MARTICVQPCIDSNLSLTIPFMGAIQSVANFDLRSDCSGCSALASMFGQINPFLMSLGIPLCALGCLGAVIAAIQAVPDSLGPPPDPTKVISAVANVIAKCKCILDSALPPPAGPICQFLEFVQGIIALILSVITCMIGLLGHIGTLSIQFAQLQLSPDPAFISIGNCMKEEVTGLTAMLLQKFSAMAIIIAVMAPIFSLITALIPIPSLANIGTAFETFEGAVSGSPAVQDVLSALNGLSTALGVINIALVDALSVCP